MKKYAIALVAILGLVVIPPVMCNREDRDLDDRARAKAPGSFATLAQGSTHYEHVSGDGPTYVLVHGTSGPMTVWDTTARYLKDNGTPYLRLDLYGRGYSDRVSATHDLDLFVAQLEQLVQKVAHGSDLVVVGSSLGAIVAAEFAKRTPTRVKGVVLIGPGGFPLQASPIAGLAQLPGLGDWIMSTFGDRQLAAHHRNYFVAPDKFETVHAQFAEQLRYHGSKAAILDTLRNAPLQSYLDGYRAFGAKGIPTLAIWGRSDTVFPANNAERLKVAIPHLQLTLVDRAGHLPQLETPDAVHSALKQFNNGLGSVPPTTKWSKIDPGIRAREFALPSGATLNAFAVDLAQARLRAVRPPKPQRVGEVSEAREGNLAVNGTFFDPDRRPLGLLVDDDTVLQPLRKADWGVLIVREGRASLVHTDEYAPKDHTEFAIQCGPRIVIAGEVPKLKPQGPHRRTGICVQSATEVVVFVSGSISTTDLGAYLALPKKDGGLGCQDALLLDGGPSTQASIRRPQFEFRKLGLYAVPNAVVAEPRAR